jgi:hypothetical protein
MFYRKENSTIQAYSKMDIVELTQYIEQESNDLDMFSLDDPGNNPKTDKKSEVKVKFGNYFN